MKALAMLDDAHLWKEICSAAQKFGYTLPAGQPAASEMAKIRAVMNDADKFGAMDIAKLISSMRGKKGKE